MAGRASRLRGAAVTVVVVVAVTVLRHFQWGHKENEGRVFTL